MVAPALRSFLCAQTLREKLIFSRRNLMAQVIHAGDAVRSADVSAPVRHAYQAYQLLHFGFAVAPIVAGLDKFFNKLTQWDMYLAPSITRLIGGHASKFMML